MLNISVAANESDKWAWGCYFIKVLST